LKSNINVEKSSQEVIDFMENDSVKFEILERKELKGSDSIDSASQLFFIQNANIKLKTARIVLKNSSVTLESGSLYYLKGDIDMESKVGGAKGLGKKLFNKATTGEKMFKPTYTGTGEIVLEPTFGHYALIELDNEEIIVDDGCFYACESSIEVGAAPMKNISSALLGNEGFIQTKLSGKGIVLLEVPVPGEEIIEYELNNDTLKVDGNFVVLRSGNIDFSVQKAGKSILGSATSGEGFLNVYSGKGFLWLLPTKAIYKRLTQAGLRNQTNPGGKSNTKD